MADICESHIKNPLMRIMFWLTELTAGRETCEDIHSLVHLGDCDAFGDDDARAIVCWRFFTLRQRLLSVVMVRKRIRIMVTYFALKIS